LLLHRYLSEPATGEAGNPAEKRSLLAAAIEAARNPEARSLYRLAFDRWVAASPPGAEATVLTTADRVIAGLGTDSVLETGIRLHHTYGLPVIPGSALKGLAAHYCNEVWGQRANGDTAPPASKPFRRPTETEDDVYRKCLQGDPKAKPTENYFRLLFGNTDDSGVMVFHDAWLTPDSAEPLVLDVMTPHHPDWQDGSAPPTDFDSPVPVAFVSATGSFRVMVSWNGPVEHGQANNWTKLVLDLLKESLYEWGIGGKTSSGYGRLIGGSSDGRGGKGPEPTKTPIPWTYQDRVTVTLLEQREINGKPQFKVQEEGVTKPGWLSYGVPPTPLPALKTVVVVYRNNVDQNNPQYRWDPLPPPAAPVRRSGQGRR
jgi:CRISPR-associated protein Cmr6